MSPANNTPKNHPVPSPHLPLTRLIYSDLEWAKKIIKNYAKYAKLIFHYNCLSTYHKQNGETSITSSKL